MCGINDDAIQHHLLLEYGLMFVKAQNIVQNADTVAKNVKELHCDLRVLDGNSKIHKFTTSPMTRV